MGPSRSAGLPLAVGRRADQLSRLLDADRRRPVAAGQHPERRRDGGAGADGDHFAGDAPGAAGGGDRRRLRPALAAGHRAGVRLGRRRHPRRPDRGRTGDPGPDVDLHLPAGYRWGGAAPDLAGRDPRARTAQSARGGDPAGDGRDQRRPRGRTRARRSADRRVRSAGGLRRQRGSGGVLRDRSAPLAPDAHRIACAAGAIRGGAARRWPLRLARAGRTQDPAAGHSVHRPGNGALGPASPGRPRASRARCRWLRRSLRRPRDRRDLDGAASRDRYGPSSARTGCSRRPASCTRWRSPWSCWCPASSPYS